MVSCWGLTSGQAGMVAQVKALASALKLEVQLKKADIRKPFSYLPNAVYPPFRHSIVPHLLAAGSDSLTAPYPDVVISCGRRAALMAMGLKTRAPHTRFIHIQDPQMPSRYFDLVGAMQHDAITGANVLKTRFALHAITPEILQRAKQEFEPVFAAYAAPRIAVLLGGSTNKYTLDAIAMKQLVDVLQTIQTQSKGSLLITPSRRTGEANIRTLNESFAQNRNVYIYDFSGANPYLGLLAVADAIVVTNDSVNMMSEALATGKPVYILPLSGHSNTNPARFAETLIQDGLARTFGGTWERWTYSIPDEMKSLSEEISKRMF